MEEMKKYGDLATIDSLTQVLNRGRIQLEIVTTIERCRADQHKVSLIMFDIDHFKNINDTYGHSIGDDVLKTIAGIARSQISCYQAKIGRWGGEEFMIVLEDITCEKVVEIAEEIRTRIAEHHFDTVENITSSFGVIEVLTKESTEDALRRVDAILYQAKTGGRNKVVID